MGFDPLLAWALVLLSALTCQAAERLVISPDGPPISRRIPEDVNVGATMPEQAVELRRTVAGLVPEQVHLTYWGAPDKMAVSFASGAGLVVQGRPPAPPRPVQAAAVQWGASDSALNSSAQCATGAYVQDQYAIQQSAGYVSPYLSSCLMTGLPAGARVFYRVGWPAYGDWSPVFDFTTFKARDNFPFTVGVMADLGLSFNSSLTVRQMFNARPKVVLNIGDLPYADNFLPDGREGTLKGLKYLTSYQPRWDMYGRMLQALAARVPVMSSTGNHEVEFQPDSTVFAAYTSRYPVPQDPSQGPRLHLNKFNASTPSPDRGLYYSWDVPGTAHFVALTSYITNDTFSPDTAQYKWLEADLAKVNRTETPWLVVYFHAPFYSTYEASFKQVECMRLTYEPLMYRYGVDFVLNGHVHAYERFKPVFNNSLNPCGAIHITIGCGGKPGEPGSGLSALDLKFIEEGSFYCKDPRVLDVKPSIVQPLRCHTYQPQLGGFCWAAQPPFSALRETAFGAGVLRLINRTHASWSWNRNDGRPEEINDFVMVDNSRPGNCSNRGRGGGGGGAAGSARPGRGGGGAAGSGGGGGVGPWVRQAVGRLFSGGRRLLGAR